MLGLSLIQPFTFILSIKGFQQILRYCKMLHLTTPCRFHRRYRNFIW
ncbi:hypothetical protein HMPREF0198_1466 [Cardiobacterium hominis ATCC 15826]|uniref:Uncharacterized protein n=1 Tax=Cardiobacterium hominis (strain ATCC 15826 / DSM 8339 / NCTC 10426 / 6573) TaxID=638300 RepID=C8NAD8_CARH6|nr:hypothetical protein HMPREF0198_1466 [Cardiobacterium hominis ATCC 15826]